MDALLIERWSIKAEGWTSEESAYMRSIFFQGNGRIGLRASLVGDKQNPSEHGLYMAGVFSEIKNGITDMVNLPDPFCLRISVDGIYYDSIDFAEELHQQLDMQSGILERHWIFRGVKFTLRRSVSFARHDLALMSLTISSDNIHEVVVYDSIDASVMNSPVNDDQCMQNDDLLLLTKEPVFSHEDGVLRLSLNTKEGRCIKYSRTFSSNGFSEETEHGWVHTFTTGRDSSQLDMLFSAEGKNILQYTFSSILESSIRALHDLWKRMDVEIGASAEEQGALRFSIFSLIQNAPDQVVSIGARGLTHGRYKGCYFWDTDVFLLPYFLLSNPETAEFLVDYRLSNLDSARKNASALNSDGARFPWMCSLDGSEQCESWDTGKCEMHVTADVAWSIDRAADILAPAINTRAGELYAETARFWVSRLTYIPQSDEYQLLFVKGPDEYCGVTRNNTFTNVLIKHNLGLALKYGSSFLSVKEKEVISCIIEKIRIPYSEKLGTYLPDDTYELLEDVDIFSIKKGAEAAYHRVCFDRLQRYKLLKQPDVLLLYAMLPKVFSREEALNAWNEYEKRTLHDSTLSWGSHALIAYMMGKESEGWKYLEKAMFLDLRNLMGNTDTEGLHIGAAGTVLETLFYGILGLKFTSKGIESCLHMPHSWSYIKTGISYRGKSYRIIGDREKIEIVQEKV